MSKTGNNDLFDLIKSLKPGEKKAISLRLNLINGGKNHNFLFEIVNAVDIYNEKSISKALENKGIKTPLPRLKIYLQEFILKTLRDITQNRCKEVEIRNNLIESVICHKKGLINLRNKKLNKALKLAEENEYYELQLDILNKLWLYKSSYSSSRNFINSYNQKLQLAKRAMDYRELIHDTLEFEHSHLIRDKSILKKWQKIFESNIMLKEPLSKEENYYFHQLHIHYKSIIHDFEGMIVHLNQMIQLIETSEKLQSNPSYYYSCINNLIVAHCALNNLEEGKKAMEKLMVIDMNELNVLNQEILSNYIISSYTNLIRGAIHGKEFLFGEKLVNCSINFIDKIVVSLKYKIPLFLTLSNFYICVGKFKEALKWNNNQLNSNSNDYIIDAFVIAKIFNIIIHYELKHYDLLPYLIRSTYRTLTKIEKPHSVELILLNFIRKDLIDINDDKELIQALVELKSEIKKKSKSHIKTRVFDHIDIVCWIDKKISN